MRPPSSIDWLTRKPPISLPSSPAGGGAEGAGVAGAGGFCAHPRPARIRPIAMAASLSTFAPTVRIPISCLALPEENRAEVGSVNLRVAHGARLVLR